MTVPALMMTSLFSRTISIKDVIICICSQNITSYPAACLWHWILVPTNAKVDPYNIAVLNLLPPTSDANVPTRSQTMANTTNKELLI
jgi:hypothetical protein